MLVYFMEVYVGVFYKVYFGVFYGGVWSDEPLDTSIKWARKTNRLSGLQNK